MAKKLMGDDEAMRAFVCDGLKSFSAKSDLIHGVFNTTDNVLAAFRARCAAKGIDFGKFSWVGSEQAPEFDPNDPETVVVLDATLDTLKNTFEFAWAWTADSQEKQYRWEGMVSDPEKLTLLDGLEFKPFTLRWVRIKLDTNVGSKPIDVRNAKTSPGCALLFMSAEHPERIKATDYKVRFGFWLPGLKCTAPDGAAWRRVPHVFFFLDDRQVELHSSWYGHSHDDLAVPSFRE
ncbi:MAG: hypothetical protein WCK01_04720 [Candidatus Uhrbacteria bacterium]